MSLLKFRPKLEQLKEKGENLVESDVSYALINIMWKCDQVKELLPDMVNEDFDFKPRVNNQIFNLFFWYLFSNSSVRKRSFMDS
jgi:hypothetical protein